MEYVSDGDPTVPSPVRTNSTRLAGATDGPVRLGNVAEAVRSTDAVNLGQLQRGLDSSLSEAKLYTDTRFAELDFDLGELREESVGRHRRRRWRWPDCRRRSRRARP